MEAVGVAAAIPADRRYIPAVLAEVMEAEAASSKSQKLVNKKQKYRNVLEKRLLWQPLCVIIFLMGTDVVPNKQNRFYIQKRIC